MATRFSVKTTFEPAKTIEPIYTGGDVSATSSGSLLTTCVGEDVLVVDTFTGDAVARIEGDGEQITSLCISPSGSHVVICSRSLTMRIYALKTTESASTLTPEALRTLKPHTTPVVSSAIDRTGSLVATGGADGTVKVWDIRGGFATHNFHGHGGVVSALTFFQTPLANPARSRKRKISHDHDHGLANGPEPIFLASGGEDGKIRIWNLSSRKSEATLDSHVSVVRSLSFSDHHQLLLSASRDRTMILWHPNGWKEHKVIPALEVLENAAFLPASEYCYAGGEAGVIRIWNTQTGKEATLTRKPGFENNSIVTIVSVLSSRLLISIHQDQSFKFHSYENLLDLPSDAMINALPIVRRISGNHDEIIDMACIGSDRSLLALATNTESIRLISASDMSGNRSTQAKSQSPPKSAFGSDVALLEGHEDIIICLDVDWSGHWLATGAKDNSARLWRLDPSNARFTCFAVLEGHAESLGAIALPRSPPPGGALAQDPLNHPPAFVLTGSQDKTIKRWDTAKLKYSSTGATPHSRVRAVYTRVAHEKDINALDVSPIAPLFASASQDRTIKIWSLEDGSVAGILRGHKRGVWSVKFSPAGTPPINLSEGGSSSSRGLLVSGSGDRTVKIWSLSTYTCLLTLEGHSNSVLKVLWLPPPARKISGSEEDEDEDATKTHQPHNNKQPLIASASSDTLVKVWSPYAPADSDHLLATLDNHSDRVWALATPQTANNNNTTTSNSSSSSTCPYPLISGAADATITFWRDTTIQTATLATQRATERIEQDQQLQNHIRAKNYREVITLALALNHPGRLLRVFEDVITNLPDIEKEPDSITGLKAVDNVLATLDTVQIYTLLERIRDWNTNARTSPVAQRVLHCLLKSYPASMFTTEMAQLQQRRRSAGTTTTTPQKGGGMKELLRGLEVYTERHYKRMEDLVDESYLLEYTLREMDEVAGTAGAGVEAGAAASDGIDVAGDEPRLNGNGSGSGSVPVESDMIML